MLSKKTLLSLYEKMLLIRLVEERIADKYAEKKMRCPIHLSIGQEAVAAGVCENLIKADIVYSNHRCHAHYLAKGGDLNRMIAELYGKKTGCCQGRGGSMHLIDLKAGFGGATPIVGNSVPIAVGVAFANKMKKHNRIAVAFLGDGTMEEGVMHECLNFASLKKIPILFICENNFYSVYTSLKERQPNRPIYKLAAAHGIYAKKADGYDVIKVFEETGNAIKRIKIGKGPVFLELTTYRWREHCGPSFDNHLGYRSKEECHQWQNRDSILTLKQFILNRNLTKVADLEKMTKCLNRRINTAFRFAEKSPFPDKRFLYEGVYGE